MGNSQADKAANHERIVRRASSLIRRDRDQRGQRRRLMAEAGLTHGGFYRHFESRDELVAEAVESALAHGSKRSNAAAETGGSDALAAIIDGYLSRLHRDKPETGCAVAALPTDIVRSNARAREAYSRQVRSYLDLLAGLTADGDSDDAHLILATLVGAVALSRAVDDPASRTSCSRARRARATGSGSAPARSA